MHITADLRFKRLGSALHGVQLPGYTRAGSRDALAQLIQLRCLCGNVLHTALVLSGIFDFLRKRRHGLALLPQVIVVTLCRLPRQQAARAFQRLLLMPARLARTTENGKALLGLAHHLQQLCGFALEHGKTIAVCFDLCQRRLELAQLSLRDFHLLVILTCAVALHDVRAATCALIDQVVEFGQSLLPLS